MKMKALDASHLLIILTAQETRSLGLDVKGPNWGSLHCRLMIARIFSVACAGTEFAMNKGQIAIKAMETVDGQCVLMFSTITPAAAQKNGKRKVYKIKSPVGPFVYCFDSAGDMLNAVERLSRAKISCKSRLLRCGNGYRLVLTPGFTLRNTADCILQEYGTLCGKGSAAAAMAAEHGQVLCDDAVNLIGKYLTS